MVAVVNFVGVAVVRFMRAVVDCRRHRRASSPAAQKRPQIVRVSFMYADAYPVWADEIDAQDYLDMLCM